MNSNTVFQMLRVLYTIVVEILMSSIQTQIKKSTVNGWFFYPSFWFSLNKFIIGADGKVQIHAHGYLKLFFMFYSSVFWAGYNSLIILSKSVKSIK